VIGRVAIDLKAAQVKGDQHFGADRDGRNTSARSPYSLDARLNVGSDEGMRALAERRDDRSSDARHALPGNDAAFAETPLETDAWWLSRSAEPTFARQSIPVPASCARRLRATEGPIAVEFNGATFEGAAISHAGGRCELTLGSALSQEMAEVLDADDGIAVEVLRGRARPTLSLHPYVDAR
jgi:hypothetical protein